MNELVGARTAAAADSAIAGLTGGIGAMVQKLRHSALLLLAELEVLYSSLALQFLLMLLRVWESCGSRSALHVSALMLSTRVLGDMCTTAPGRTEQHRLWCYSARASCADKVSVLIT